MKIASKRLNGILYDGGYDGFAVNSQLMSHDNTSTEQSKRAAMAYVAVTTPETFETLKKDNIVLFQGTNSNALPGILKYGMKSGQRLTEEGVEVITGEESTRMHEQRSFISFTDDLGTASEYATLGPLKKQKGLDSFGVVIGISKDNIKYLKTCKAGSDIPELGIEDSVPLEYIKSISVPKDKVEFVRKMCRNDSISITPIDLENRFFKFDESILYIDNQKFEKCMENEKNNQDNRAFTDEEIKGIAFERRLSKIKEMYRRIKEKNQNKGRDIEYDSRTE